MTGAAALLFATLAVPLAMLSACVTQRARERMPALLALAPVPALVAALLAPAGTVLVLPEPPFRMTLALDAPGAMLLGAAALLWIIAGAYASAHLRGDPNAGRFAEWWLLTLTGSLGVFIAADLVSFYLTYSVVSLAAWGLIVTASVSHIIPPSCSSLPSGERSRMFAWSSRTMLRQCSAMAM
jgi:formate hydrogenlyase subunit 3/multisubunit Na+/H+ antiporter MnhD subunit